MNHDILIASIILIGLALWLLLGDILPRARRNAAYRADRAAAMLRHPSNYLG